MRILKTSMLAAFLALLLPSCGGDSDPRCRDLPDGRCWQCYGDECGEMASSRCGPEGICDYVPPGSGDNYDEENNGSGEAQEATPYFTASLDYEGNSWSFDFGQTNSIIYCGIAADIRTGDLSFTINAYEQNSVYGCTDPESRTICISTDSEARSFSRSFDSANYPLDNVWLQDSSTGELGEFFGFPCIRPQQFGSCLERSGGGTLALEPIAEYTIRFSGDANGICQFEPTSPCRHNHFCDCAGSENGTLTIEGICRCPDRDCTPSEDIEPEDA